MSHGILPWALFVSSSSELLHLLASFSRPPASAHCSNSADPKHQQPSSFSRPPNISSPSAPCPSPRWCQQRWHLVTSLTDSSDNSGLCLQKPSQQMATTRGISLPSIYTQDLQAQICAPGFTRLLASPWHCGVQTGLGELGVKTQRGFLLRLRCTLHLGRRGALPPWQFSEQMLLAGSIPVPCGPKAPAAEPACCSTAFPRWNILVWAFAVLLLI